VPSALAEEIRTFFRHCPACGRRFEIRLIKKKLVDRQEVESDAEEYTPATPGPMVLESEVPLVVEVDDFSYTYRCKHCGHQWSEEHFDTEKVGEPVTD